MTRALLRVTIATTLIPMLATAAHIPDLAELKQMTARFAPTDLRVDTSALSPADQKALAKLIGAARIIDAIFMEQLWSGDAALYNQLKRDTTPLGKARLHYFWINKGPWSDLDGHTVFIPGVPERKPLGANFYPEDMTREEFEAWLPSLSKEDRDRATGFFTVIRRDTNRRLTIHPYNVEYRADLVRAARDLEDAAALTGNRHLEGFPREASRRFPLQRLLRQRSRLDGSRRPARHHHRPV